MQLSKQALLVVGFLVAAMIGCSDQIFVAASSQKQRNQDSNTSKPNGFVKDQQSASKKTSEKNPSKGAAVDRINQETTENLSDPEETNFVTLEDQPDSQSTAAAIQSSIEDCGAHAIFAAALDQIVFRKQSRSIPFVNNIGPLKVKTEVILNVEVSPTKTIQKSEIRVLSVDGPFASIALEAAQTEAQKSSATLIIETVEPREYAKLSAKYRMWRGISCTFVAAKRLTHIRGTNVTVVRFDPPLPISLSPKPIAKIFESEIGNHRTFKGIQATIEQSNEEKLRSLNKLVGQISIKKIDPSDLLNTNTDPTANADIGYHMLYNFENPELTQLLGLAPEISYFINFEKRDLVSTLINPRLPNTPVMTFIYK